MNREEKQEHRKKIRCRHFNGIQNEKCEAGLEYPDPRELPCLKEGNAVCEKYSSFTAEELAEQEKEFKRQMDLLMQGLSSCCEAPIDTTQVIQSGRYKGHGPRICSKCRKLVFRV